MSEPIDTEELRRMARFGVDGDGVFRWRTPLRASLRSAADEIDRLRLALTAALSASPAEPEPMPPPVPEDQFDGCPVHGADTRMCVAANCDGIPRAQRQQFADDFGASPTEPVERDERTALAVLAEVHQIASAPRGRSHPLGWRIDRIVALTAALAAVAARPVPVPAAPTDEPPTYQAGVHVFTCRSGSCPGCVPSGGFGRFAPAAPDPDTTPSPLCKKCHDPEVMSPHSTHRVPPLDWEAP